MPVQSFDRSHNTLLYDKLRVYGQPTGCIGAIQLASITQTNGKELDITLIARDAKAMRTFLPTINENAEFDYRCEIGTPDKPPIRILSHLGIPHAQLGYIDPQCPRDGVAPQWCHYTLRITGLAKLVELGLLDADVAGAMSKDFGLSLEELKPRAHWANWQNALFSSTDTGGVKPDSPRQR